MNIPFWNSSKHPFNTWFRLLFLILSQPKLFAYFHTFLLIFLDLLSFSETSFGKTICQKNCSSVEESTNQSIIICRQPEKQVYCIIQRFTGEWDIFLTVIFINGILSLSNETNAECHMCCATVWLNLETLMPNACCGVLGYFLCLCSVTSPWFRFS